MTNTPPQPYVLPIEPMLAALDRRGGICQVMDDAGEQGKYQRQAYLERLKEATERGWITLFAADRIACNLLHRHLFEMYGELYFEPLKPSDFQTDEPAEAAAPIPAAA